jgi:hypothetical protein
VHGGAGHDVGWFDSVDRVFAVERSCERSC